MPISEQLKSIESKFPWSFSGFLLAIIFGILSVYLGFYKNDSPQLNYLITSSSGVLDIKEKLGNLDVLYKGKSLSSTNQDLQVITFKVINQGNATITNDSYDPELPIGFVLDNGLLAEEPQIINTSNKYIEKKLSLSIEGDKKVTFSNVIIEPEEFFEIKVLILYEIGKKPSFMSIGKVADVAEIGVYDDYISKLSETSFLERLLYENTLIQISRVFVYGIFFFIIIIIIAVIAGAIEEYNESRRKKGLLSTFKSYKGRHLSRTDELFFDTYLSNGMDGLKLISSLVTNQDLILEIVNSSNGKDNSSTYTNAEVQKATELIQEEVITIENHRVQVDLERIQILTDLILYLERNGEDIKTKYPSIDTPNAEIMNDFSKQMSSLKSDQLKMQGSVAISEKNFSKAIEYFEEYLEHCPNDSTVFWKLAYAKKHTGDLSKAIELIESALSQSDKHSYLLYYNYACYLALDNQPVEKVIDQLTTALNLDKGNHLANAIVKDTDLINVSSKIEFTTLLEKYNISISSEGGSQ